ncbi:MAG: hypothetical protein H7Y43_12765, partial [Akkermansiaceae bacterium]|nr:hypothetical protein [Verrucomicrobiales bacterium]
MTNGPLPVIGPDNFLHAVVDARTGQTNLLPGLRAECYEGYWEVLPDFDLLQPVTTGVATHFDLRLRTRDEKVGLRFTGYFKAPHDGAYIFHVRSDDGSLLFLGKPELPVVNLGVTQPPVARPGIMGKVMGGLDERQWLTVEGRVSFVSKKGCGLEFDLRSGRDVIGVRVADATGFNVAGLLNSQVKITGIGRGVLTMDQHLVLGRLFAASGRDVIGIEQALSRGDVSLPIVAVGQVQSLPIDEARRALPVRIRGVVTDAKNSPYDRRMSLQDDTRGIFVSLDAISNSVPAFGEFWEVTGRSAAGDFAPVVIADQLTFFGEGRMPEPARPAWKALVNGSMDVQWTELQGLVTAVQSNRVSLLLPEGRLEVQMEDYYESDLKPFLKTVVRICGVFYAVWNAETREVRVGHVLMRNATVSVQTPAPADPFDAVLKTPRELLLFDAQATAFQRVRVRGQVIHVETGRVFLMEDGTGLRILPAQTVDLRAGDLAETVGYPEIKGSSLLLHEVIVRKTGEAALPAPRKLTEDDLMREGLDSTLVRVEGKMIGLHTEQGTTVLEMQSGRHLFLARLGAGKDHPGLQAGSRLALTGVYVGQGRSPTPGNQIESFELRLNSPADITILSKPSWWTLQRLLIIVGVLLGVLIFAFVWITQLQRQVEQRTRQLQREIREREHAERQQALEAERSRIARDLHDDLGSSLTEISVLASTGQRPLVGETSPATLFRAIANKARGLVAALDVIVWAVDPEDNSLQSLGDYLSGFTGDYLAHSQLTCRFKVPVTFPSVTLNGQVRHGLLMAVKESLNNIVRHAEATEVEFRMVVANDALEIVIADNGKGFNHTDGQGGHGLKNLLARLNKLGGICLVESRSGGGTTVTIHLPLPALAATTSLADV